jgi:hypothetical protein
MNEKNWYFTDTKSYNAFIKLRRDHLKMLGVKKYVEVDFFEFIEYKK